ncbi:ABC transporter [Taibaiella sp. KBW10]|nr:ABC transporter [Taibaiella sp. KBW10]
MIIGTLLLTFVGALAAQVNALLLKYTVDEVAALTKLPKPMHQGVQLLILISAILIGKELLNIFIQFGQKFFGEKIRINISSELSQKVIDRLLSYKMAFFAEDDYQSGKLQTRIDQGVSSLTKLIQNFFIDILPLFTNAIIALIIMFSANFYVGLLTMLVVPLYFYVSAKQAKKLSGVRRKLRAQREHKNNGLLNLIQSISVIKSFVRERYEGKKQYDIQMELMDSQLETRRTNFLYDGIKTFIEQIGIVLIIILTVYLVLSQQITIGAIMLHIMLFSNVSAPIRQLHRIYDEMNDAFIYAEGYFDILENDEAIEQSGSLPMNSKHITFSLQGVNFTYPNGFQALHDINLVLEKNKTIALVGLSGAGKSTLINLLCKFYSPDSGAILLNGTNLNKYENTTLREHIGLVLQKNHIFKGTIEENIRYGKLEATTEEIILAAQKAYLHEQIMELPLQYQADAQLLSGGQQQRIAIARLFLKDPPILFLDEPTASLDAIATEQIKKSLDAIKQDRTVVIISHSLSQIIDADMIVAMEHGRIAETGTHATLYQQQGVYRKIFDAAARSLNLDKMAETLL